MIWEQIRSNRVKSIMLVIGMGLLLLLLGYVVGLAFADDPVVGLVIALVVWGIMSLVAWVRGDSIILAVSGAHKIGPEDNPRLYNVVEEMKIASGLEKMPAVYIIDDPALNAFATGRDPKHAAVAITSGLLEKLNRDELQGVIGHEMSHIKNRDVLTMSMCAVMLGAIVILGWYVTRILFFSRAGQSRRKSSGGGGGGQMIIMVAAIVLMILAPIMAQLIYFAVSRKREYLADASSALYTRYPEGLASALEKIGASTTPVKSANKATAPMYISNPFRKEGKMSASAATATHPPIAERVRILRSMGGASFADYDQAFRQARGKSVVPASALTATDGVPLRQANPEVGQGKDGSGRRP